MTNAKSLKSFFIIFAFLSALLLSIISFLWYENEVRRLILEGVELQKEQHDSLIKASESFSHDLQIISSYWHLQHINKSVSIDDKGEILEILFEEIKSFLDLKDEYDQFRIIEKTGMEILRLDRVMGRAVRKEEPMLQNKSDRYYFKDVMKMSQREIYLSPLDLNMEHGEIEFPFKPTLRYALPLNAPDPEFFLILNVNFSGPLDSFLERNRSLEIESFLVNSDGYYLSSRRESEEWGFMIKERESFNLKLENPSLWKEIEQGSSGIVESGSKTYLWKNLLLSSEDSGWIVLSEISPGKSRFIQLMVPAMILLYILINSIFIFAQKNRFGKKMILRNLAADLMEKKNMLRKAVILQQSFIQKKIPMTTSFNIHNVYMPCEKLGGDFFNIIRRKKENKLVITIGDCTDHGMKASMDASLLSRLIDKNIEALYEDDRTDLFLKRINKDYIEISDEDQFPTMMVLIIDMEKGDMYYSNANSESPFLMRDGNALRIKNPKGFHLGYFDDPEYDREHFVFRDNDRLFLYSDAVTDINDSDNQKLGYGGLEKILKSETGNSNRFFRGLVDKLETVNGKFPLDDDATLILLEFKKSQKSVYEIQSAEELNGVSKIITSLMINYDYSEDEVKPITNALDEISRISSKYPFVIYININCREIFLDFEKKGESTLAFGTQNFSEYDLDFINSDEKGDILHIVKRKVQRFSEII